MIFSCRRHWNGFWPVWVFTWIFKAFKSLKLLLQVEHLPQWEGFSPVCFLMFSQSILMIKTLLQIRIYQQHDFLMILQLIFSWKTFWRCCALEWILLCFFNLSSTSSKKKTVKILLERHLYLFEKLTKAPSSSFIKLYFWLKLIFGARGIRTLDLSSPNRQRKIFLAFRFVHYLSKEASENRSRDLSLAWRVLCPLSYSPLYKN